MEAGQGESATGSLSAAASDVWAKSPQASGDWLPLWRHLDDSVGVAWRLWDEWLPAGVKRLVGAAFPGGEADARAAAGWLAGVHDIGKATPVFAVKVPVLADRMRSHGLMMETVSPADRRIGRHAAAGQLIVEDWLRKVPGWDSTVSRPFAVVVGGHHGIPPTDAELLDLADRPALLGWTAGRGPWRQVQRELLDRSAARCGVADRWAGWRDVRLPQPVQVALTALVIVADWIASNEDLFTYDPALLTAPSRLDDGWQQLDLPAPWRAVPPTGTTSELFGARFSLPAGSVVRPVQEQAVAAARSMPVAGLLVVEAPMGEGKTEAALAAAEVLAARSGAGGCFVALPTRATSDAMFRRLIGWLRRVPDQDANRGDLSVMLAHGKARFNDDYGALMGRGYSRDVGDPEDRTAAGDWDLAAHRWLSGRKRALLSSFVVGTIDQLLFGALKARHLALRHLGLASKVVIIDEAHAYDVYMSRYLDRALEWLGCYGVPTIVLSATLPADRRRAMIEAYDRGAAPPPPRPRRRPSTGSAIAVPDRYAALAGDIGYPVMVSSGLDRVPTVRVAAASGRQVTVAVERADDDLAGLGQLLGDALADGGCALVVRNTVRRVQETGRYLRAALEPLGIQVSLAHSRFLAADRAGKDRWLRDSFGPPESLALAGTSRPDRHVVVASQVAEQSLDIDFDLLVTDLAPVDLVLQRMGRLHRHQRGTGQADRPARLRQARCVIAGVDWAACPPEPVRGSIRVYGRHALLRSLAVLSPRLDSDRPVLLPDDIAPLVQQAYGDQPVGPADWQDALRQAQEHHLRQEQTRRQRAESFLLAPARAAGVPLMNWLDAGVGDVDDDSPRGRAQVRDSPTDSVEVLVVVRRDLDTVTIPPWLARYGGQPIATEQTPSNELAKTVATCTLSLPADLSNLEVIDELEKRNYFPGWQQSPWLAEQLVLVLDEAGNADVLDYRLHYDPDDGLEVISA